MISQDIPREIKQPNKILFGLTIRQFVCVVITIIFAIIFAVILPSSVCVYPMVAVGAAAWAFGWWSKDGLTAETYLMKQLQKKVYGNEVRKYRTKNRYITLMNAGYRRHEAIDRSNKQIAKELVAEQKQAKQQNKNSQMQPIM